MTLALDPRRHAMLAAMGIKHWVRPVARAPHHKGSGAEKVIGQTTLTPPLAKQISVPAVALANRGGGRAGASAAPAPISLQPLPSGIAQMDWAALSHSVSQCQACGLCQGRKNTVFGAGSSQADWLIVSAPPDENEDQQGQPLVGEAGALFDNMLKALHLSRAQGADRAQAAHLTTLVKCRPPLGRNPEPSEIAQCQPYLLRQIELVQPKMILALGRFAAQALLQSKLPLGQLRGQVHHPAALSAPVVVSYHPTSLLHTPGGKASAWSDLCLARAALASQPPL
jgi:uracil-DNA glycosylase